MINDNIIQHIKEAAVIADLIALSSFDKEFPKILG